MNRPRSSSFHTPKVYQEENGQYAALPDNTIAAKSRWAKAVELLRGLGMRLKGPGRSVEEGNRSSTEYGVENLVIRR